eukprot:5604504-Pleurochrysis_carterae.AAC.1
MAKAAYTPLASLLRLVGFGHLLPDLNNRRGGAIPTMIMRLEVLRGNLLAWQALIPYYHAPALSCRALPLSLQRAVAATTVARQASPVVHLRAIYSETASYSLVTARTVG